MQIHPIGERVVGNKLDGERVTPGGIIVPKTKQDRAMIGRITTTKNDSDYNPGDVILFGRASPKDIKTKKGDCFTIDEDKILARSDEEYQDIEPVRDMVLVRRRPQKNDVGGILIPEILKEMEFEGEVLRVGPDCIDIVPGDHVRYQEYSFYLLNVPDDELILVPEDKILLKRVVKS